ncbi:carbamoyltransferase family protein [Pontibacter cellulosilyticus]|uniref:Carbamoyltransferase n=1 Tax=Pontibacter cellulosilyticus TaxID=1720253 RepID=A0A923SHD5_9BACT|nr:carbamoyltransferase [Pontibacter cellulosilyticus]MBC5991629.1 carbamoyltransferase [Pontibacter cellulosilyticus]
MYILGLNAYHGDSSASIMKDGEVIAASEEERFRRIKHWAGFPSEAIKFCLKEAGISIKDVDYVTISRDPSANIHKKLIHAAKNLVSAKTLIDRLANTKKVANVKEELSTALGVPVSEIKAEIKNIEHHRSHMASAFFASPFDEAAILSIDGFGDFTSTMIGVGRGNKLEVLDTVIYPHSVGVFYTAFTQYLGFDKYGDEYKVMGLAPYGSPTMVKQLRDVLIFKDNGLFELNTKYFRHVKEGVQMSWEGGEPLIGFIFSDYMVQKFGPARGKEDELTQYHKDLAASVQRITEELIFHILNHLQKRTGLKNICIAGGVAQNSVANGKVLQQTTFESLYIPSAGHDAGTALGSALYLYNHVLEQSRLQPIYHASTGSRFCNDEIEAFLKEQNIAYTRYSDEELYERVTSRLLDAGVVGWFQGRAEFGPRALGHRSIIVDPRRTDAKDLLNAKIKRRESFRPFAPSILKEHVSEYFEITDNVPFMEKVFPIRKEKHAEIPAVTHVDGTGRLQTVDEENNPRYYNLIKAFSVKTNVPILLNTSFNENEPIVNTPKEALDCFLRTKMDMLVLENFVVER